MFIKLLTMLVASSQAMAGHSALAEPKPLCDLDDDSSCLEEVEEQSTSVSSFHANSGRERNLPEVTVTLEASETRVIDRGAGEIILVDDRTGSRLGFLLFDDFRDTGSQVYVGDYTGSRASDIVVTSERGEAWLLESLSR